MNCDQAIELLPWLLNGTLGEDERREVREHLSSCASCRQALTDTRGAWEIFDQHIPPAVLVAYASESERPEGFDPAALEDHLATCPECAAELELVRMSRALVEEDAVALLTPRPPLPGRQPGIAVPARRPAARWRTAALAAGLIGAVSLGGWYKSAEHAHLLNARLAAASAAARTVPAQAAPPPASPPSTPAGGGERTAELQIQIDSMQKKVEDLQTTNDQYRQQIAQIGRDVTAPQVNTWVGPVRGDVVRGAGAEPNVVVPSGAPLATLLLHGGEDARGDRDLKILAAGGEAVEHAEGLRLNADAHDYSVTLRPRTLKPGDYTLQLYRREGGKSVPAESFTMRIQ
jgi:anti-sigma factor RsiW